MNKEKNEQWHKECAYAHFICGIPGMGIKTVEKLYNRYGHQGGYENLYYRLKEAPGLSKRQMEQIKKHMEEKEVWEEYQKLLYNKIWCIPKYLQGYPDKLRHIYNPPSVLYVKGRLPDETIPMVAVVGARNCSPYGKLVANEIGRELAGAGIPVVSGMASGIDGIAQRSALEHGGTSYGVLGCGVDICYPEENMDIYQGLMTKGRSGIISEYPPGTLPAPGLFPLRNRIISGLADVLVVIEAREKSGTYITVTNALEQGKDVYVVPGRIRDNLSYGCNRLIAQGANVIYDIEKFVGDFMLDKGMGEKMQTVADDDRTTGVTLSKEEASVYGGLDIQYRPAEEVLAETLPQLPLSAGMVVLATLECMGLAESESGFYRKKCL